MSEHRSTGAAAFPDATVTGYPRIGPHRELKRALESLWAGKISVEEFETAARALRLETYGRLVELGLDQPYALPADFAAYDHVLETAVAVGVLGGEAADLSWDEYFALARGTDSQPALEMTKWFDTNYHYLVPEIGPDTVFTARPHRVTALVDEAKAAGRDVRPVLVGPVTLLALSKAAEGSSDFRPLDRLEDLTANYATVLKALAEAGAEWVQLDEPALVADLEAADDAQLAELAAAAYRTLLGAEAGSERPQVAVTASYGSLRAGLEALASVGPETLIADVSKPTLEADPDYVERLKSAVPEKTHLAAGIIDGRNIWAADLAAQLETLRSFDRPVSVTTSTSLLHVPYSLAPEVSLPVDVAGWLSFAEEKVTEAEALAEALRTGSTDTRDVAFARAARAQRTRAESARTHSAEVRERTSALPEKVSRGDVEQRRAAQKRRLGLPELPTTTIGSFPQTADVRSARAAHRAGRLDDEAYTEAMRAEIRRVVQLQEDLGLDVIVHGEPERNDMVQYFAEHLDGFATTANGWVQSYGSRCTRPPILFGDVSRPEPITVPWSAYAASLTDKPVKGMLTGPVTILAWSFVRDDEPLSVPADQIALALADEVTDLEAAGIPIIQIDEPALRELLPLREDRRAEYLDWAVRAFRLCAVNAAVDTQIHTHLCYSEFGQVIEAIQALDADVTSIEAARSRMELLESLDEGFHAEIGPGVWDIHSPRVPSVAELEDLLRAALKSVGSDRLWVNPDCGLKTRGYSETEASLRNLVRARESLLAERQPVA